MTAQPLLLVAAGLLGAVGVAGAAYAAHGGDDRLAAIGAAIALVHAPAVLAAGLATIRSRTLVLAASAWILGVVLFSGDLLLRAVFAAETGLPTAPAGGTLLVLGWLLLAFAGVRMATRR